MVTTQHLHLTKITSLRKVSMPKNIHAKPTLLFHVSSIMIKTMAISSGSLLRVGSQIYRPISDVQDVRGLYADVAAGVQRRGARYAELDRGARDS